MARRIKPFDDSHHKDRRRSTKNSSTDTSAIDAYRQGVELTNPKHFANGIAKIHDGYNDQSGEHGVPQLVYGQERPILRDDNSFLEGFKFDPLSLFEAFKFPNPFISNVNPSSGDIGGGTFIALTGSGFFQLSRLRIATTPVAFNFIDDKHVTFTTPSHSAAAVDIDVLTPGGSFTSPGAFTYASVGPTITSLGANQGDQLGREAVPINGTGFTGVTSVTFGGIAAVSYVFISDALIIAYPEAHAAGTVDVVVTTGAGPSTGGAGAYTYWDPTLLPLTVFVERGGYELGNVSTGANANICQWNPRASASTSGTHKMISGGAATMTPFEDNHEPNLDGVDDFLSSLSGFLDTNTFSNAAGTCIVGFNARTAAAANGAGLAYNDPGLVINDSGGTVFACAYSTAGWRPTLFDGSWQDSFAVAAPVNKENVGQFKWSGGNAHSRVGLGAFTSAAAGSVAAFGGNNIVFGRNFSSTVAFDGRMRFVICANTEISDADCDKIVVWAQNRHGMTPNAGANPEIWYVTPDVVDPASGDLVTIKGRNFNGSNAGASTRVFVNQVELTPITVVDDNTITAPMATSLGNGIKWAVTVLTDLAVGCQVNAVESFNPSLLTTEAIWDVRNAVINTLLEGFPVATSIPNTGTVTDSGSRDLNLTAGTTASGYPTVQTFSFNSKASFGNYNIVTGESRDLKTGAFTTPITFPAAPGALRVYQVFYLGSAGAGNVYLRLGAAGSSAFCASEYLIPGNPINVNVGASGITTSTPPINTPVCSCSVYSDDATIGAVHYGDYFTKDAAGAIDITTNAPWKDMLTGTYPAELSCYHQTIIIASTAAFADGYALTAEKRKVMKWAKHFYNTPVAS